jgi:hypothetical protein
MIFWNTKEAGPVVIDVPPAGGGSFAGNIVNIWQMPLEDAGPEGADQGKGGRYLILPPGYKEKPPQGYVVLRADTYGGYALMRSNLGSHANADVAKSVAYGKRLRVYPLSRASNPGETKFTDMIDVIFDSTIPYNTRFFESLDHIIQNDVWLERDRVMIDQLKSIGIEKGKPFKPDAKAKEILDSAIQEAKAWFELKCEAGFPPLNPGIHWGPPALPEIVKLYQSSYTDPDHYPVGSRGFTYTLGYIGIKRLGTAQFYLMTMKDKDGDDFDGSRTYRLTVPANAPVKQYWSATVYDRATHALIRDLPQASRASNNAEVRKNADGSVDIYFGPRAPAGKEANWVPTNPKGKFEVLFRLYGPEKPLFDKTWKLPDIEKVK